MSSLVQIPSIILPRLAPSSAEVETINDLLEHTSIEIDVQYFQEKQIHIVVTEVITAGVPGNLQCWIELSPFPSTVYAGYWAAIGGGGGALDPTAPLVEVATGVTGTVHSILIPWTAHSAWARLIIQTPVSATPLTAFWILQAIFSGKGG